MIRAEHLVKRYGVKTAVDDITFEVRPGIVTGFLGPNGAGKSTTMRMIIGLDAPTSGEVTVNGRRYADHAAPLHEVGALLEARAVHTGRTARNHLLALAATHGISTRRVDEVVGIVGLSEVAAKRAGGFSLGMGQRLGLAAALLGDPATLILDEPVNGLDPEGIRWIRNLLKGLAAEGRTVLVSSHLMNEMAVTADHVIVVGRGRVIADVGMEQFVRSASSGTVRVRAREQAQLGEALVASGAQVESGPDGALRVTGATAEAIGDLALARGVAIHELVTEQASLEEAFMEMTADAVEYRGSDAANDRSAA
jgi:ABC-2 type transport system ATP-binding protein